MASGRVTVRLDAETCRRLEMFAALRAKTPSGAQEKSCYDLARDLGLVGAVRNAPRDLSTDRKHLQGFGRQ
jgi:hypothetical protein